MRALAALAGLAAAGVLSAAVALWAFARFSDQARIRGIKRQIKASLYEMRLFVDEPMVLLRAQKHLVTANLRYLGLMLRPVALISAPMFLLLSALDAIYGYRPLNSGEAALLTVYVLPAIDLRIANPSIAASSGVAIETPVVRIPGEQRFCWRIRATRAGWGRCAFRWMARSMTSRYRPGPGLPGLPERVRSRLAWILNPAEQRLPPVQ